MSAAVAESPLVKCAECGRENELERIYCHDCGAKLDRSAVIQKEAAKTESPEDAHKRLQGMFSQRGASARFWATRFFKLFLSAGIAAALVLAALPPDVPPLVKNMVLPAQINMDLEAMTLYHRPPVKSYPETEVNAFVANALRNRKKDLSYSVIDFERALVAFTPGVCQTIVERSIFGYSLYTSASYRAEVSNGKFSAIPVSGAIGRLPIHPLLLPYFGYAQADVVKTFAREHRLLDKIGGVEFRDKEVAFAATAAR